MFQCTPEEIKRRVDAANAILPRLMQKVASMSESDRKLIGHVPATIKTSADVTQIESIVRRVDLDTKAPAAPAKPSAPAAPSLGAKALAAVTDPKTAAPAVAGINKAILEQAKRNVALAEIRALKSPRARLEALRDLKNEELSAANAEHEKACATKRDEILARSRSSFTKK